MSLPASYAACFCCCASHSSIILHQINHIPQMLCHASAHRWGHSQGRVDTNEIVIHEVRRDLPASDRRNIPLAKPHAP